MASRTERIGIKIRRERDHQILLGERIVSAVVQREQDENEGKQQRAPRPTEQAEKAAGKVDACAGVNGFQKIVGPGPVAEKVEGKTVRVVQHRNRDVFLRPPMLGEVPLQRV